MHAKTALAFVSSGIEQARLSITHSNVGLSGIFNEKKKEHKRTFHSAVFPLNYVGIQRSFDYFCPIEFASAGNLVLRCSGIPAQLARGGARKNQMNRSILRLGPEKEQICK